MSVAYLGFGWLLGLLTAGCLMCIVDRLRYPELPRCRCAICEPDQS